jgi:hypothetical protein
MESRIVKRYAPLALAVAILSFAQGAPQENTPERLSRMSDAEQVAMAKSLLDRGLPSDGDQGAGLGDLALGRSALILPLIEAKLEDALKASNPLDGFTDKTANPEAIIMYLWEIIAAAGDKQSLLEASKLLKLDEKRFDRMVLQTMYAAYNRRNAFTVAYRGFDLGDPAIDKRLIEWASEHLGNDVRKLSNPIYDNVPGARHEWAEALVERYGAAPSQTQWMKDPIASRLKPELSVLEYHVRQLAGEEAAKRNKKQ